VEWFGRIFGKSKPTERLMRDLQGRWGFYGQWASYDALLIQLAACRSAH